MILSFQDKRYRRVLWRKDRHKQFSAFKKTAERKLAMLDSATELRDLLAPPGNRLEKLKGNRAGQHSIRINDQWRICFVWEERRTA